MCRGSDLKREHKRGGEKRRNFQALEPIEKGSRGCL